MEEGEPGEWEGWDKNGRRMGGGGGGRRKGGGTRKAGELEGGGGIGREAGGREGRGSTIYDSYHYKHLLCNLLLSSPIAVKGSRDFDSPSALGGLLPVAPPPLVEGPSLLPPAPGVGVVMVMVVCVLGGGGERWVQLSSFATWGRLDYNTRGRSDNKH